MNREKDAQESIIASLRTPVAPPYSIRETDLHIAADDARGVFGDADRGILNERAGRDVVLPAVPRAGDDRAAETAFVQRTAAMKADVVDRVIDAVDVEQSHHPPVDGDEARLPGQQFVGARNGYEVSHEPGHWIIWSSRGGIE